jgi:hypothetical protein
MMLLAVVIIGIVAGLTIWTAFTPPPPISIMPLAPAYNSAPRWLVCDGHHRLMAARHEGHLRIAAKVVSLS